jgi:hypothetical protein
MFPRSSAASIGSPRGTEGCGPVAPGGSSEVEYGTLFHVRPASLETHVPFGRLAFAAA